MKSFFRIVACLAALCLLVAAFALPVLRTDSRVEDSLRKLAFDAAEEGDVATVEGVVSKIKSPAYLADANASLAYAYHKLGDFSRRNEVLKSDKFAWDSYLTRSLVYDLKREPDFMKALLEVKYLSDIKSIRSDFNRAVPLYLMGVRMGERGGVYIDEAFELIRRHADSEYKSAAVCRICRLSLDYGRCDDFVRFLPLAPSTFEIEILIFESVRNNELQKVWKKNEKSLARHNYVRQIAILALSAIKRRDEESLKKVLRYYPLRYNLKWRYNNFKDFNYPLYAYFAKMAGDEELYRKYLALAKSEELRAKLYGDRDKYAEFSRKMFKVLGVEDE